MFNLQTLSEKQVNMAEQTDELEETAVKEIDESQIIDSKYRKIILAAQRSKQLQRGAMPRIEMDLKQHKPTRVAMKELESGIIHFDTTKEKKSN